MADYRATFPVAASPDEVVRYLVDLCRLPEWDSSVRGATLEADTGPAVGRRFAVTVGFYGREFDAVYEITEFTAASSVSWTMTGKASGSTHVVVSPDGSGSTVDYRLDVRMSGLARLLDKGLNAALEGIGANVEQGLQRRFAG